MPVSKLPTQKSLYGFLLLCCKLCYANFIWRRKWIHNNRVMLRIRKETPAATQPFGRRPTKHNGANYFTNNLSRVIFHVASVHEGKQQHLMWHLWVQLFWGEGYENTCCISSRWKKYTQMHHLWLRIFSKCSYEITCCICSWRKKTHSNASFVTKYFL